MIIESIDGRYYENPVFIGEDWAAGVYGDTEFVVYCDPVHVPKKFGFHGEIVASDVDQFINQSGALKRCWRFHVKLSRPIPTPNRFASFWLVQIPQGEPVMLWSWPVSNRAVLDFLQSGYDPQGIARFLGKNPERKIRQQIPRLQGVRVTNLNYDHTLARLPETIKLKRRAVYENPA